MSQHPPLSEMLWIWICFSCNIYCISQWQDSTIFFYLVYVKCPLMSSHFMEVSCAKPRKWLVVYVCAMIIYLHVSTIFRLDVGTKRNGLQDQTHVNIRIYICSNVGIVFVRCCYHITRYREWARHCIHNSLKL